MSSTFPQGYSKRMTCLNFPMILVSPMLVIINHSLWLALFVDAPQLGVLVEELFACFVVGHQFYYPEQEVLSTTEVTRYLH